MQKKGKIELLAPAGGWGAFTAAVENGADAVYLGGKQFSARQNAGNFDMPLLKKALDYAHIRGVLIYLAMNTLIADSEIEQAVNFAGEAYIAGIDGIILQDVGFAGLLKKLLPGLPMHASTQMTIYNLNGVKHLENIGFKRVIPARELSLDEIRYIAENTSLEIEVFIHGAMCISYSGQCLMSSIIGARSGNRGNCAQPCRQLYEFSSVTGSKDSFDFLSKGYLLSPKDICSLGSICNILKSGVKALKIEGRMKGPEYVATVVRIYRKYLDLFENSYDKSNEANLKIDKQDLNELTQIFNRGGFTDGYFYGKPGSNLICIEKPKNWGIYIGKTISADVRTGIVRIRLENELSLGDGVEIWSTDAESPGNIVTLLKVRGKSVNSADTGDIAEIGFIRGGAGSIPRGSKVYKTSDKKLNIKASESFSGKFHKKVLLDGILTIKHGEPVSLIVKDRDGNEVNAGIERRPEAAVSKSLTREKVQEQLIKTGNTPFEFDRLEIRLDDGLSLSISIINSLRRQAIENMERARLSPYSRKLPQGFYEVLSKSIKSSIKSNNNKSCSLNYDNGTSNENRCSFKSDNGTSAGNQRNTGKKSALISAFFYRCSDEIDYSKFKADRLYIPFDYLTKEPGSNIPRSCREKGIEVYAVLPAVTRGNYDKLISAKLGAVLESGVNGLLAGSYGSLIHATMLDGLKLSVNYSFNMFNSYTVEEALKLGLSGVTLSPELTLNQVGCIEKPEGMDFEAVIYGRLLLMTSEYCPADCRTGKQNAANVYKNAPVCNGRIFSLKDRIGKVFPLMCNKIDCRSYIFNTDVIFLPELAFNLDKMGIDSLRLDFTDENSDDIHEILELYRDALCNGPKQLSNHTGTIYRVKAGGFTRGHYYRGVT